ncbi:MAG TPA: hypothetical protein VNH41_12070 [Steroidobacteraceae bacterium]|nr:hypothetical protein [Steroidobacteraceae bacterium]
MHKEEVLATLESAELNELHRERATLEVFRGRCSEAGAPVFRTQEGPAPGALRRRAPARNGVLGAADWRFPPLPLLRFRARGLASTRFALSAASAAARVAAAAAATAGMSSPWR